MALPERLDVLSVTAVERLVKAGDLVVKGAFKERLGLSVDALTELLLDIWVVRGLHSTARH